MSFPVLELQSGEIEAHGGPVETMVRFPYQSNRQFHTRSRNSHRSYFDAVELGFLTADPAQYNDPNVCASYRGVSGRRSRSAAQPRQHYRLTDASN